MSDRITLTAGTRVTLDASGYGEAEIGPGAHGKQNWRVTGVILKTNRPGKSPIPRAEIWLDSVGENNQQGLTYDGSFKSGACDITLARGQHLVCHWTGGKSGDIATITVTGEAW